MKIAQIRLILQPGTSGDIVARMRLADQLPEINHDMKPRILSGEP